MSTQQWIVSELKYGRKVLNAGLEGTRSGREAFLNGKPLTPFLRGLVRRALLPAAVGAFVGGLSSCMGKPDKSSGRIVALGLVGSGIGFAVSLAWESRKLTATALSNACKKIGKVRDERWFERHPIDYA
jgi:hypothetical protein